MIPKDYIFPGSLKLIEEILEEYSGCNIFLVRGNHSFEMSGAKDLFEPIYKKCNITEFSDFSSNPKLNEAEVGYLLFKESNSDLIIAVGGGSVIDTAKIIKYLHYNENQVQTLSIPIPIIAVPTTAGTGSEATNFAVVYIDGVKHSYEEDYLLPDVAIIDSNLLKSQSEYQIAVSGLDALAQGIESYWNVNSTQESMEYASEAIKLIWENLRNAVKGNQVAMEKMAYGSFLAGKAIRITKTTGPHALSYYITSNYNLAHGHAVSIFLPIFFKYNSDVNSENCNDKRGCKYVVKTMKSIAKILKVEATESVSQILHDYIIALNIEINFKNLGISRFDIDTIIGEVNEYRFNNNPRKFNRNVLVELLSFELY